MRYIIFCIMVTILIVNIHKEAKGVVLPDGTIISKGQWRVLNGCTEGELDFTPIGQYRIIRADDNDENPSDLSDSPALVINEQLSPSPPFRSSKPNYTSV